jgi:hypothetical protein
MTTSGVRRAKAALSSFAAHSMADFAEPPSLDV